MTTAYTSLLGLALPVQGELQGTWGDTVNNSITSLLDTAVAGTTSITTDADITLTTTTGASNQARQAIILWNPASGTTTRNITAPAQSKIYTVINASGGTQSIVFRGAGPTTGVTIVKGESAVCAWNGTDFIKVSNTSGAGTFTNLSASGTVTFTGLSSSQAVFTDASDNLVSNAITGTGNVVMSASPTLTGTITASAITASGTITGNGNWVLGNADTDTITVGASYVTGTALRSAKVATNTLNLAAYDVDGAAYTNLITLTASNTPTLTLTSTGVGTIDNISIGATTASTGSFTTLSASSTVSGTGFSTYLASPPAIGGTAAAAGSFTTLSASGTTTLSGNQIISVTDNTNAALRITQLGSGNALLVEDSTNPDSTPFVINNAGQVVVGDTAVYASGGVTANFQVTGVSADTGAMAINSFRNSANGAFLSFAHSKSGVLGTQTTLVQNDATGLIRFSGSDGTVFIQSASIEAFVDGTPGTNDMPGRLVFSTTADGAATPTERMRIDSSGNVGVGTTSPATKLDVVGTIQAIAAATQDAVRLAGRAGGTGTFATTLTPTTLTANRTITLPDATTTVVGTDTTQTMTNKWLQPRVLASTANSATPTLNTDSYDMMVITAQSVAITSFTTNLTGTPVNGQKLWISITGSTAIAITWGASFESSTVTLPSTTVTTNRLDIGFVWNVATAKWRCVAYA